MNELLSDFPKLHCPFIRQTFKVNREQFKTIRGKLNLRQPEVYLVVDKINPGYEWVFEDSATIAVEKLNGTNIKIKTEAGRLVIVQNRKNVIDPLQIVKGQNFIMEGLYKAADKDYIQSDKEQSGELIGPKLQANPYKLDYHLWYSFERSISSLQYKSFNEHERTFDNLSSWFKDFLFSRFYDKSGKKDPAEKIFAEGVIFYNLKRRAAGQTYMAKLRRDMFYWYYDGLEIFDYVKAGREESEDQDKFE